jgi:L-malate glycosyltransferase
MKIFYFIDSFNIGGSEYQTVKTAICLKEAGHQITVGCLQKRGPLIDQLQSANIEVVEFSPGKSLFSITALRQIFRLARYLRLEKFEIFHAHDLYSDLLGVPAAWIARIPRIVASRRDLGDWWWYTPRNRWVLTRVLRLAHVVVANSSMVAKTLQSDGIATHKIRVLRNAIEPAIASSKISLRLQLLPNSADATAIVTVANMHVESKGHHHLIAAAKQVINDFPKTVFVLIGDGPLRPTLQKQAVELSISENVLFLGQKMNASQLVHAFDIAVLPSLSEGLPNSVLEYMSAGLPTVATSVGGIPELIDDGIHGILVPPGDSNQLSAALIRIITNPTEAQSMGTNASARAKAEFGFERLVRELEELYASGINGLPTVKA